MPHALHIRKTTNTSLSVCTVADFACSASSSYLTELVRGMTLEEAAKVKNTEIAKELVRLFALLIAYLRQDHISWTYY